MVRILIYDKNKARQLSIQELFSIRNNPEYEDAILWVDMDNPSEEEEETILIHYFLFHSLAVEDCQRERLEPDEGDHYPKVEDYHEYLFVIFNPVDRPIESFSYLPDGDDDEDDKLINIRFPTRQINAFLGKNLLVTHHYESSKSIDYAWQLCQKNDKALSRGPDYLFHIIIDQIVENYAPLMEYFDDLVDKLEISVFQNPQSATLSKILSLKKGVQQLKKISTYQREILNRLSRGEFALISRDETFYYRNVYDHLVRIVDLTENYRDLINGLQDAYLSVASNKMNEVMKVLTVISTIFLPLTLITGIYGMNFENMPELSQDYGYPMVWVTFILLAGGMLLFFKRRGWLDL